MYVTEKEFQDWRGFGRRVRPNTALLWLNDPSKADVTLTQARAVAFGLGKLQFITRTGVRILLSQAAGIVISLLVAFSLVALVAAGTMLVAGAHADVQRRLTGIGVQRALGFGPGRIAAQQAVESAVVALPAAAIGIALGALIVARPAGDLLAALNEIGPGWALLGPLALALLGVTTVVVGAGTWPAWRAARRPPGRDPARRRPRPAPARAGGGASLFTLGVRFATAARGRWFAAVATIAVCAGVVTLMLALASLLERLREDPGTVGKRYQLAVALDSFMLPEARKLPGVAAVGERYSVDAADSFRLGEPVRLIAYPGDHTEFEDPPLAEGRRIKRSERGGGRGRTRRRARPASPDRCSRRRSPRAARSASASAGSCARSSTTGGSRGCNPTGCSSCGRTSPRRSSSGSAPARTRPRCPATSWTSARACSPSARRRPTTPPSSPCSPRCCAASAWRSGLVCLYALVQALTVTARERRGAVALLRACGADAPTVALVLAGAAIAVAVPAAIAGVVLETFVFGPLVARLAAGFASLPLAPTRARSRSSPAACSRSR